MPAHLHDVACQLVLLFACRRRSVLASPCRRFLIHSLLQGFAQLPHAATFKLPHQPYNLVQQVMPYTQLY